MPFAEVNRDDTVLLLFDFSLLLFSFAQVPVQLDTNVSCPEGINEVLAEDDVSWQIKKVWMLQRRLHLATPAISPYKWFPEPIELLLYRREDAEFRYETIESRVL